MQTQNLYSRTVSKIGKCKNYVVSLKSLLRLSDNLLILFTFRPDQVKWYRMLAECHRGTTEYDEAIAIYKASIEEFPRDITCLKAMIKLVNELGLSEDQKLYKSKLDQITSELSSSIDNK